MSSRPATLVPRPWLRGDEIETACDLGGEEVARGAVITPPPRRLTDLIGGLLRNTGGAASRVPDLVEELAPVDPLTARDLREGLADECGLGVRDLDAVPLGHEAVTVVPTSMTPFGTSSWPLTILAVSIFIDGSLHFAGIIRPMAEYDRQTALIVVDVQNDFADPAGRSTCAAAKRWCRWPTLEIAKARRGRRAGDLHAGLAPAVDAPLRQGRRHLAGALRPRHLGRRAASGLDVRRSSTSGEVVRKVVRTAPATRTATPAFEREPRARRAVPGSSALLRERGIERLVVLGLATDYCVRATALDGLALGFPPRCCATAFAPST